MAVTRQLISRIAGFAFEDTDKSMKRWKLELEDYNVILEFAKGVKNEANEWDWSNAIRLNISDRDIDSLYNMLNAFSKNVRGKIYNVQTSGMTSDKLLANPFIVTSDNKYIISIWCILVAPTETSKYVNRSIEFRVYPFDGNWNNVNLTANEIRANKDAMEYKEYTAYPTPMFVLKISNQSKVKGVYLYEDLEALNILTRGIESCIFKDSAVFVDHYRQIREANGDNKSGNVGYNKTIPSSSEPAAPSIVLDETDLPF